MAHIGFPPGVFSMFEPRPPLVFKSLTEKKKPIQMTGVSNFLDLFEDPKTAPPAPSWKLPESRRQKLERIARERKEKRNLELKKDLAKWDPSKDPKIQGEPNKTLFIARLSYETTEQKLRREFETYGPIKRIRLVKDLEGKPRGYAFIEFEHSHDMKNAAKYGDNKRIDDKRIIVDAERGRTDKNWKPRRLGGGLGISRASEEDKERMRQQQYEEEDHYNDRYDDRYSSSRYSSSSSSRRDYDSRDSGRDYRDRRDDSRDSGRRDSGRDDRDRRDNGRDSGRDDRDRRDSGRDSGRDGRDSSRRDSGRDDRDRRDSGRDSGRDDRKERKRERDRD